ncbi:MAG: aminotransferase class I/II-fold pyridoxal phosphate-dependent enzyme, partial [Actinomycetota bacterium]|nr:aminotransferase class I/II-fold pyridoxal phosphate-dependent enzyme [Actinomycetota bacterium]
MDQKTKVVFIASPNNPSGNVTDTGAILELLQTGMVVVVDEAYYEFSGVTVAPLVPQHHNLIVLRSMSKWAGLAG